MRISWFQWSQEHGRRHRLINCFLIDLLLEFLSVPLKLFAELWPYTSLANLLWMYAVILLAIVFWDFGLLFHLLALSLSFFRVNRQKIIIVWLLYLALVCSSFSCYVVLSQKFVDLLLAFLLLLCTSSSLPRIRHRTRNWCILRSRNLRRLFA